MQNCPVKANVKTNRMGSTIWVYQREWSFVTNYLRFLKIKIELEPLRNSWFNASKPKSSLLFVSAWVFHESVFPVFLKLKFMHFSKLGKRSIEWVKPIHIPVKSTLHKKWSFPLRISPVNVTKSAALSCGFGHIYWRNP